MYSQYGAWAPWLEARRDDLISTHGLASDFAERVAILLAYAMAENLQPRISRGWSDPKHQQELRDRWDRGDRAGLRVRPAANSNHTKTGFMGRPASLAIDIPCRNDDRLAAIARALGIGAGADFKDKDPGHYYKVG